MDISSLSVDDKRRIFQTIKLYEEHKPREASLKADSLEAKQLAASGSRMVGMAFLLGQDEAIPERLPAVIHFLKEAIKPEWER